MLHVKQSKTFSNSDSSVWQLYGSIFYPIKDLFAFPLVDEEKQVYEKWIKLANSSELKVRTNYTDKIPIYFLYKYDFPIINSIIKLGTKVLLEFFEYDYAVIILEPLTFLKQIGNVKKIYANSIIYKNSTPFESDVSNKIHYLLYKKEKYPYQAELRIVFIEEQKEKGYKF